MFEISYTKVRAYLNCPWLYKLKFIDEWKAPPSAPASLGISLHKALELFHRRRGESRDYLQEALEAVWERSGYDDASQELEFYDKATGILDCYWQKIVPQWKGRILEVEKEFSLEMPEEGLALRGTIDRLDELDGGKVALIEYKTHAEEWSLERMASDLQMAIYLQAMKKLWPQREIYPFFFFVAQGRIVEIKSGLLDSLKVLGELLSVRRAILERNFLPNTNYCFQCDLRRNCQYSIAKESGGSQ